MRKTLTAVLLSTSLLVPSMALAQGQSTGGALSWLLPKQVRVAAAPTAADVLTGVQNFYAGITGVKAKFRQEVTNTTFGRTDISDGVLLIQKPGNMRWQYFSKKRQGKVTIAKDFVSNGNYLYVVDYENKQVIKKDLQKNLLPTAVTFLYGKGDLAKDFTPELESNSKYGGKSDLVLRLLPKTQSAQYKTLHLVVDPTNFRVKESIIIDSAGNKNHFRFYEPDFKASLKASDFQFSEKNPKVKSFRVIDGDKDDKATAPGAAPLPPAPTAPSK